MLIKSEIRTAVKNCQPAETDRSQDQGQVKKGTLVRLPLRLP